MNTGYLRSSKRGWEEHMLRLGYAYGTTELKGVLRRFNVETAHAEITLFRTISPDAFIWKLQLLDGTYYLYAEDYIQSLASVKEAIDDESGGKAGQFITAKQLKPFHKLSAVQAAETYTQPVDFATMQPYIVDSGLDLVFLYKLEKSDE